MKNTATNRERTGPAVILIAAMAANRVIGRDNTIPWHIPGEQKRFKEITMGHPLIMGRKTWEAIGRPLPGRRNIVISRNPGFQAEGGEVVHSMEAALTLCRAEAKVFIIGGEQIYRLALSVADTLILSVLPFPVAGDARFPDFSADEFYLRRQENVEDTQDYAILTYARCGRKTSYLS